MRVNELFAWMRARHSIYKKKEAGEPKPWTDDPILQGFRFCNVYRELDTETRWIHERWLRSHEHVWFAMVVARLLNWHESLGELGFPLPWNPDKFVATMHARRKRGDKVFNGAYIVSTNGVAMDKVEYLAGRVLTPLWGSRNVVRPRSNELLRDFHSRLMRFDGMGSFMAAQVIADTKHTPSGPLAGSADWWTFAASGPGSRRGLNRIFGNDIRAPWRETEWHAALLTLKTSVDKLITKEKMPKLDAQNLQNCLCEFDKYERVRLGEGRPKSTYNGRK